ncbi:alpha-L-rhamnosidase [Subtercola endophyticus]|uniref:alpha-L-rhamnosidase n=1 Tax=Subtercola endophyticus TaxID=2895559 RepID=UPI001E644AA0|nr:alpha-L-rhamnosidase [Subtercola endophyticus]UFS58570.1 glycoside hydrolase family 78 protein [Subtercola endophyticus]
MSSLQAYDLRTEYRETPLGIDTLEPRFSWRLRSETAGANATAARLTVSSDQGSSWSSGWISPTQNSVAYEGELASRTRYTWVLELRDEHGDELEAASSWFETALLSPTDFAGLWVAVDNTYDAPEREFDPPQDDDIPTAVRHVPPAAHLRRSFTVKPGVARARLYATAHGIYTAHLNGKRLGTAELAPGWTEYTQRLQYQSYDVTNELHEGDNALGILLADGWWSGYVGFDARRQGNHYGVSPEAWAQLEITYDDGSTSTITSDDEWQTANGRIHYTDLLMGEYVDARRDLGDWTSPGYDTSSGWAPAATRENDFATFIAEVDAPIEVIDEVSAKSVVIDAHGRALYDFGQNLVGRVRVDLGALAADQSIILRHGEVLENDELYTANLRTAQQRDVYVSAGADENVFEPTFTMHGFRYLEIDGLSKPAALDKVTARVLSSATPPAGEITTSSADVNQLISNIRWGQRGNFAGLPTDCPQRDERLGWMADAQVFLPTAALNADVAAFFTRWLADVRGAQSAEGSFPDVAPVVSQFFYDGAPAWADAGVIIPWHLYKVYGDRRLLETSYESMTRWVDFVEKHNPNLIWTKRVGNHYGDWLQIDALTPRPLMATAYFAHSAELVAKSAAALGKTADAEHYADLTARIKTVFSETFTGEDGRLEGDTQTDYLLALAFDLVEGEQREAAKHHLVEAIEAHDGLLTTGFVGVSLLCPVLSEIGRDDLAYALLETDRYPSWLYSVRQGATTIWERWDGWTEHAGFQSVEMNSFNHYSLGSVGEWLYRYVAGIDQAPDSVAYERLVIAPRVGGSLTSASAHYDSVRGRISSAWQLEGSDFTLDIEVPPGAVATVVVPGGETVEVLSGRHQFTSVLRAAELVG